MHNYVLFSFDNSGVQLASKASKCQDTDCYHGDKDLIEIHNRYESLKKSMTEGRTATDRSESTRVGKQAEVDMEMTLM